MAPKSKSPIKSSPSQESQNSSSDSELEGKVKPENDAPMEGVIANSQEQTASTSTASTGNTAQQPKDLVKFLNSIPLVIVPSSSSGEISSHYQFD